MKRQMKTKLKVHLDDVYVPVGHQRHQDPPHGQVHCHRRSDEKTQLPRQTLFSTLPLPPLSCRVSR